MNNLSFLPPQHKVNEVCQANGLTYMGIFGSQVRGEANEDSDVDVLIETDTTKSLFELVKIQAQLESLLTKKVDLVLKESLKGEYKQSVLSDLVSIYDETKN